MISFHSMPPLRLLWSMMCVLQACRAFDLSVSARLERTLPRMAPFRSVHLAMAESNDGKAAGVKKALFGRFRSKREVEKAEKIAPGQSLPDIEVDALLFNEDVEAGEEDALDVPVAVLPIGAALGNGTSILVGMPGAFTPTCNDRHLPGFVNNLDKLRALGVERVAVMTTNDRFVNSAWRNSVEACMQTKSGLIMLSDADGDIVKALGLVDDMGFGLGVRSQRFVLVLEDGVVKHVAVDEGSSDLKSTSAEATIEYLQQTRGAGAAASSQVNDTRPAILAAAALLILLAAYYATTNDALMPQSIGYQKIPSM
mmetsp:Transcript_9869/g.22039  ORF Transcript_9869/g.22039 Transcript_9869/m.22039 type:complete len:312 (+) Transcript_9869:3-938(+)